MIRYVGSYPTWEKMPRPAQPEFAFIGRSNVGKSSLINMLTGHKNLARTSSVPGKTQMINQFSVTEEWLIVDLPGYGYARLSKKQRQTMEKMVHGYLLHRPALYLAFLLLDIRVTPQKLDMDMLNWLGQNEVPLALIYTKADKLKEIEIQRNISTYEEEILQYWSVLPPSFITSSQTGLGRDAVLSFIENSLAIQ